jgi:pyruvate,orthophosphate dikinase
MRGLPVTIRLIDPPLHEFLPRYEDLLREVAQLEITAPDSETLAEKRRLLQRVEELREANPMLGLRGVRLSLLYPEIVEMQVAAILEAAAEAQRRGYDPHVEIMIPLVARASGARRQRSDGARGRARGLQVRHNDRDPARPRSPPTKSPSTPSSSPSARTT